MPGRSKLRVFLDTNVLFSGLCSGQGPPGKILDLYLRGEIFLVVSRQVLQELVGTINTKLPAAMPVLERLLTGFPPQVVADPAAEDVARAARFMNVADARILAAAIQAEPDVFVTGDAHFLDDPIAPIASGIPIMTPAQFIDYLGSQEIG